MTENIDFSKYRDHLLREIALSMNDLCSSVFICGRQGVSMDTSTSISNLTPEKVESMLSLATKDVEDKTLISKIYFVDAEEEYLALLQQLQDMGAQRSSLEQIYGVTWYSFTRAELERMDIELRRHLPYFCQGQTIPGIYVEVAGKNYIQMLHKDGVLSPLSQRVMEMIDGALREINEGGKRSWFLRFYRARGFSNRFSVPGLSPEDTIHGKVLLDIIRYFASDRKLEVCDVSQENYDLTVELRPIQSR